MLQGGQGVPYLNGTPFSGSRSQTLLDRAGNGRKGVIRVRPDQANRADNQDQDDGQHYGIFRNVLAVFIVPEIQGEVLHHTPFRLEVLQGGVGGSYKIRTPALKTRKQFANLVKDGRKCGAHFPIHILSGGLLVK